MTGHSEMSCRSLPPITAVIILLQVSTDDVILLQVITAVAMTHDNQGLAKLSDHGPSIIDF